jgi:hypothetical protein
MTVVNLVRIDVSYSKLRQVCLEEIRHWPGCETVAGLQLVRDNTLSGFSINITLYGQADKRIADRAKRYVERTNRRRYRLSE